MNLNNFTLKAQESVQKAFNIARGKGQQAVECAHLLKGVVSEAESIADYLFGKAGIETRLLIRDIDRLIDSYPKVSGAEAYISPNLSEAFRKAGDHASDMKDKFITPEHLILGILETGDESA
ncbi:MAG: type VI secretion system ATPase TssH, partial [Bacteroidales bacterium]|nr:type VI secretion system ATPase TssH [Bacteroidales bacterium]